MSTQNSRQPTGYPPVTEAEERAAAANELATDRGSAAAAAHLSADSKIVVDALTRVFEEHRKKIDAVALDPATKRYALDLLDVVYLDVLQAVLSESSAIEALARHRIAS